MKSVIRFVTIVCFTLFSMAVFAQEPTGAIEGTVTDPQGADVHLQLARVYEKRGERPRAAAELEQYLKKAQNVKNAEAIRQAIKTLRGTPTKS